MHPFKRTAAPAWLEEKAEEWGRDWEREKNKGSKFRWRKNRKKGYEDLVGKLSEMTADHCAFCDNFSMSGDIPCEVEHFRPKSTFPLLAFTWTNLYPCCGHCQRQKSNKFDERLLQPDHETYSFDDFFEIMWESGRIEPNRAKSLERQERARITIEIYGLNAKGRPTTRKRWLQRFPRLAGDPLDSFPFRFMLA